MLPDVALLKDAGSGVKSIQCHFYSKASEFGIGSPTEPLLRELINNGIDVVLH